MNTNAKIQTLQTRLEARKDFLNDEERSFEYEVPEYITKNIRHKFFDWQKDAFENLLLYNNFESKKRTSPTHLMFNMATGSGKTVLMASAMLYYYKQGYRHFLFFVNQKNIVNKTEGNFLDDMHSKYLFTPDIIIDNKIVKINSVDIFSDDTTDIEIKFTTIQKLHTSIYTERENEDTLESLLSKDLVMLADEAHHLNKMTKKDSQKDFDLQTVLNSRSRVEDIEKCWEHTVTKLLLCKDSKVFDRESNKNILLEFTATIPEHESIIQKYQDKIIYEFPLIKFLKAGYTKEVNLIASTLKTKDRILQALLFNWYRHKIALKNNIANFKPVILFRSKNILESKEDYHNFLDLIQDLKESDLDFLKDISDKIPKSEDRKLYKAGRSKTAKLLYFIKSNNIQHSEIITFFKDNFTEQNCIITNSKDNSQKTESTDASTDLLLNSLEDKNNTVRAIFTVERLTEGWDVLNLFDIVRLYQGQNAGGSTKAIPTATVQEKQLIGRGVRYFPFSFSDKINNKRKFDNDLDHELRILEELFYYTFDEDSRYISHIASILEKEGYISSNKTFKTFDLKDGFKKSEFSNKVVLFFNEQTKNEDFVQKKIMDLRNDVRFNPFKYFCKSLHLDEHAVAKNLEIFETEDEKFSNDKAYNKPVKIKDIDKHIFYKAMNINANKEIGIFKFNLLKTELQNKLDDGLILSSIRDLMHIDFFGNFEINFHFKKNMKNVNRNNLEALISNEDKLNAVIKFLEAVFVEFDKYIVSKIGSKFSNGNIKSIRKTFGVPKTKIVSNEDVEKSKKFSNEMALDKADWFVLDNFIGTSEERELIKFVGGKIDALHQKYENCYLLRNEEVYKIYNFKNGDGFYPDFLLFLQNLSGNINYYHVFIEAKGSHLIANDSDKNLFLNDITDMYGDNLLRYESKNYRLIGLPFFNSEHEGTRTEFEKKYEHELL